VTNQIYRGGVYTTGVKSIIRPMRCIGESGHRVCVCVCVCFLLYIYATVGKSRKKHDWYNYIYNVIVCL